MHDSRQEPLTEDDLAQIEARCEAVSPGEWTVWADDGGRYWDKEGNLHLVGYHVMESQKLGDMECGAMLKGDAEFVVASRTDVPRLLAEVRRLRGLLG